VYAKEIADTIEAISTGADAGGSISNIIVDYSHHPADIRALEITDEQMEEIEPDENQSSWKCVIS
jgi:hypothetical protein